MNFAAPLHSKIVATEALDAALADIDVGKVGHEVTLRYLSGDEYWIRIYARALRFQEYHEDKGRIERIPEPEEGWAA